MTITTVHTTVRRSSLWAIFGCGAMFTVTVQLSLLASAGVGWPAYAMAAIGILSSLAWAAAAYDRMKSIEAEVTKDTTLTISEPAQ